MAELQVAALPRVGAVAAAAQLPVTERDGPRVPQPRLEQPGSGCEDLTRGLRDLPAPKGRSCSSCVPAEGSQHGSGHGGFSSAGLRGRRVTGRARALPSKPPARRKEGVDRSYPLQPLLHLSAASVPAASAGQLGSSPRMEEAPSGRAGSKSKGKAPAGRSQPAAVLPAWTAEPKQSASHLYRRELAYILRLEADGQNLEEQIRKKEALLREKLRRTKEELRRIQREKELVEAEERRARDVERTHVRKAVRHPEEKTERVTARTGDGDCSGVQSAEVSVPRPSTTLHLQELAMGKLKKERLVASNNKIRDRVPMEGLATFSEPASKHSPPPSALPDHDYSEHLPAEVLYMQAASTVEQGELGQCSFCGRKFLCSRLKKHTSICSKSQGSKRKVFDSSKARARGTELEEYQQWKSSERPQNKPPRRNNWRQKHEVFIQTLRQARQAQQVLSKGGKVSDLPPLPPIENPDYVACPYCRRRFAPQVAERHVPKCKTLRSRPPSPPQRRRC
ncbi:zinc finger C2HC domain-containing protein 1C [Oxyura jamaicensis]|uniref:zinc finger C2HC domain-containing protein 1C n=1 Tax=Oxyura jamaicensis TaxID=8884 RepID=UPI0015A6C648|nr:zinc finger C2HC domain-containing protein 1C [Oxyura jamaicensis]